MRRRTLTEFIQERIIPGHVSRVKFGEVIITREEVGGLVSFKIQSARPEPTGGKAEPKAKRSLNVKDGTNDNDGTNKKG